LTFTMLPPSKKMVVRIGVFAAPAWKRDQFSYLVKEGFQTPALTEEGMYLFRFELSSMNGGSQEKEIWVTEPPAMKRARALDVGISGVTAGLRRQLDALQPRLGINLVEFKLGTNYAAIISAGVTVRASTSQNVGDTTGLEAQPATVVGPVVTTTQQGVLAPGILEAVRVGTPLLAIPQTDALSDGVAKQLAEAGAFTFSGNVGDFRAPWMGNWYFVRKHPLYEGMPIDQAMGIHYQAKGRESNGLLVDRAPGGAEVEIVAAYSRDHDRRIGAGTFTTKLGAGKVLYHRVPEMQPVLQARFLANALRWLTS